ncbi:M48 family metallopeptidase [Seonamhaeicola sp.]|uniref:M48 family metallopeptidase n=1 Tax=Seonamhaeicola sp. TaxID=1912245 RepID=UPI00260E38BF|nr:M48 family metallopeptidase [Seonamhaeicola sp.]
MTSFYTKISAKIPENFTKPTNSFKKHVWLSVFGLLTFIAIYLLLTIWFGRLAYNLFLDALNFDGHFLNYIVAIGFGFLSLFMAKSLFFLNKKEENPIHKYINEKDEPILFDYLYKLADEAGAPRPHKVFFTDRVNASVSYDISLINLLIPSKKNLEIGLGLVNVLSLGEFKAVLAHEFGHFAQRSMLLGRYVYVAQQVAARIVGKRDIFDSFLAGLSRFDLRVAWIGWILSILVWAIRSLIETCFSIVVVAERALSREMEFQADLVAVSLTGSDALIHALYKLQIADEAYANTLDCVNEELSDKRAVKDMYELQTNYIQQMANILDDSSYGQSPKIPLESRENNRIFTSKKYNPPQMWSTHPADVDRENNAKKIYIYEPIDERSSWSLFSDPKAYREDMTERLIKTAKVETEPINTEDAIANQNKEHFNWTFLDPKYHSNFLSRYTYLNYNSFEEALNANLKGMTLEDGFKKIYPKEIAEKIKNLREVEEEIAALLISESESLTLEKRRVWHRGNQIKRKDIPEVIKGLREEVKTVKAELGEHDALCRTLHYRAAEKINGGWDAYLKKLNSLVHYSEHSISNLNDVVKKFNNVLGIALADGNVSSSELVSILSVSDDYFYTLKRIYADSEKMNLDSRLLANMKVESYQSMFEEFKLTAPVKENINDWINVIGGWTSVALRALQKLRNESLELLLDTEASIKKALLNDESLSGVGMINGIPEKYKTLTPGSERHIQRKLKFWDRFAVGDGIVPSIAKFGIAGSILFAALFFANYTQKLPFHIYNGLQTDVSIEIDGTTISLKPNATEAIQLHYGKTYQIETKTYEGESIEQEVFKFPERTAMIYNAANGGVFIEHPVFYGYGNRTPKGLNDRTLLGARKFFPVKADYILEEPPTQISLPRGSMGERKEAVRGFSAESADNLITIVEDQEDFENIVKSHSMWDDSESKYLADWMYYLKDIEDGLSTIEARLDRNPDEVVSLRLLQDVADSTNYGIICEKHTKRSLNDPENPDYYYLAARCIEDENLKDNRFIEGYKKWKDHTWLAFASGFVYSERNDYEQAYNAFSKAAENPNLESMVGVEVERIRRLLNLQKGNDFKTVINSEDVIFYNAIESGNIEGGKDNPDYIYYLIHKGSLEEAYRLSDSFESIKPYTDYLIVASSGVTNDIKDVILNQEVNSGLNLNTVWGVVGLAIKENIDYKQYLDIFEPLDLKGDFIEKLIGLIQSRNYTGVEQHISELRLRWQLQSYVMASVMLDGNIPNKWKQKINAGLFASERPFLN